MNLLQAGDLMREEYTRRKHRMEILFKEIKKAIIKTGCPPEEAIKVLRAIEIVCINVTRNKDDAGKAQPGSRAYFKSIKLPGVHVTDIHSEHGTVYVMLTCEDWVDTESARRQYETICQAQIPVGMDVQVNTEPSQKGGRLMNPESAPAKIDQMEDRLQTHPADMAHLNNIIRNQMIDIERLKSAVRGQTNEVDFLKRRLDRLDFFAGFTLSLITVHLFLHLIGWI